MKREIVNIVSIAIGIAGFLSAAVSGWYLYKTEAAVTEAALSLAGAEIERCIAGNGDSSHIQNYLAFADLNEASKEKLLIALTARPGELQSIAAKLRDFSYSREALQTFGGGYRQVKRRGRRPARIEADMEDARVLEAEKLLRTLFDSGVRFKELDGDGIVYLKRYYCANVCLDVCMNGTIRYLCYLDGTGTDDRFFEYFFKQGCYQIEEKETVGAISCRVVVSDTHRAILYIDTNSGHTVAANIAPVF